MRPQYSEGKPHIQIQSELCLKLGLLASAPTWLYTTAPIIQKPLPTELFFSCPVCQHSADLPISLKRLSLQSLLDRVAINTNVRMEVVQLTSKPREKPRTRDLSTNEERKESYYGAFEVYLYWAGQCKRCSVVFWSQAQVQGS